MPGGYSAERIKQAIKFLTVLELDDAQLDEDGLCGMLLQAFPEAPQQMA